MGLLDGILENVVGPMLGGGQTPQATDPLSAILNAVTGGNRA